MNWECYCVHFNFASTQFTLWLQSYFSFILYYCKNDLVFNYKDCCVWFFKKIIVIYFFNLDHHVPAHCVCIGQKRSPRTGVRDGCDQTCECRELNPDLLQAQHVILTTGLSLQPNCYFERKLWSEFCKTNAEKIISSISFFLFFKQAIDDGS